MRKVNLQSPLWATRWLKIINFSSDPNILKFKKNLKLPDYYLGFSFETNNLGLVQIGNQSSEGVILGTSFACGVGVDVGDRWFDNIPALSNHFNASFPSSLSQLNNLLSENYKGPGKELILIYHPNFWSFQKGFNTAIKKNIKVRDLYKWRTGFLDMIKIYFKNLLRLPLYFFSGRIFYDSSRRLDNNYCVVDIDNDMHKSMEEIMKTIVKKFSVVKVYIVPVREQLSNKISESSKDKLKKQSSIFIDICNSLQCHEVIDFSDNFNLKDYHLNDNHWNIEGNITFSNLINSLERK